MVCSCDWHSEVFGADKTRRTLDALQLVAEAADLHQRDATLPDAP